MCLVACSSGAEVGSQTSTATPTTATTEPAPTTTPSSTPTTTPEPASTTTAAQPTTTGPVSKTGSDSTTSTTGSTAAAATTTDPLATAQTCTALWDAAVPVLGAALDVLNDGLGGLTSDQVLDLATEQIDLIFGQMEAVDGYQSFTQRRDELRCANVTPLPATCTELLADLASTTLNNDLQDQWGLGLPCG